MLKHGIENEEHNIHELRSYLKGLKVIEELHRKQLEMHTSMMEALQILSEDVDEMDFVKIIALFRGKENVNIFQK